MATSLRIVAETSRWPRPVRTAGLASVPISILIPIFAGTLAAGCGLRLDILEPAPDGGVSQDAAGHDAPVQDAPSSCVEGISASSGRCEITSLACGIASGCPASWGEAQLPSSCSDSASIVLAGCGGAVSWTSYHEFTVLSCYYDPTSGKLQGFHQEADHLAFCGNSVSSRFVGDVPANCASDGGVYTGGFSCTGADAGLDQPIPCGNTTCAPGQYCRAINNAPAATCDPSAGASGGACVDIPTGCAGVATCDCIAALSPGCACCVPRGGGVLSCSAQ